ncbi:SRPBCC domain-containing protein [Streptomyces griseorubiginosus]|uniref:SRPBCC domain-containing protein n=1 Tax=Streptomyces griseorubiginosus TaxID=67304 RepID=UPI002E80AD0D|nr:SRPBCC domain-containing protein [Streptomyces griseorubiginosus]WUB45510.1 SRPBCC domain-containing protein [Streptomyces griseorubiginosus]WUB54028.1 SRPBCC domain-containing protein [Streptomyces griseorubiginosus]
MEHEVFVPVPVERLREALGDPAGVARAVPGLQQDAGAEPVAGRLKVRVGSHSITYRGAVRVTGRDDGSYAAEGEATEARGTGSVKLTLTLRLRPADDGTTLAFEATATADGRVTELPQDAVGSAVVRLLNRFAEGLAETVEAQEPEQAEASEAPDAPEAATSEAVQTPEAVETPEAEERPEAEATPEAEGTPEAEEAPASAPAPTPVEDFTEPVNPPAEAAHARRTMIGRSAEEVDHAPPRGRYAPVPAPQTVAAGVTLRWAAPAAAVVLASAIVVTRVLRKRR